MSMTLSGSNGITFNDASTQSTGKQACKAWVNFNGVTTATIRSSFNTSSVTRNSSGNYTMNFTTAMTNADYASLIQAGAEGQTQTAGPTNSGGYTTTAFRFEVGRSVVGPIDVTFISVAIFN